MTAKFIRELRKSEGLTLQDFAVKIGCTVKSVHFWEHEKAKPNRMTIKIIKSTFNV